MTDDAGGRIEPCTLLVVHPHDPALLVVRHTGRPPVLPTLREPDGFTPAAQTAAVRGATGVDAVVLRRLPEPDADGLPCAVLVPRAGEPAPTAVYAWSAGPTGHPQADAVLAELAGGPTHPLRPSWYRRGFPAEIAAWTAERLAEAGTALTGPLEQVQLWELSSVWRGNTAGGRVYVKATAPSPLFAQEGTATAALARLFPGQVPAPLAVDADRHWMIVPDLGPELRGAPEEDVRDMVRAYARLQVASAAHVDTLLDAGCVERRLPWLVRYATAWLSTADLTDWVDAARAQRLRALAAELPRRLAVLDSYGLPDTLLHGDLHSGNVARRPGGYAYFDWSDASVGHPFIDMITIRWVEDPAQRDARLAAYLGGWQEYGTPERLRAAWDAAEVFTALHHAVSYASIVANLEPPPEPDLVEAVSTWLAAAADAT